MGVPVMELFLVQSADKAKRGYTKGILDARRMRKDFGKPEGTITPVKVTLTKDGVLEALNAVPFKARVQPALRLGELPKFKDPDGTFTARLPRATLAEPDLSPRALRPPDWRKLIDFRPESREQAQYPTTGLYDPGLYPQFKARLKGKHPQYVMGFNKLGPPGQLKRKVV